MFYDSLRTHRTLTRNYPVAARLRWPFYDLRPFVRADAVEGDPEGKPYSFEARNPVQARAHGETDTHPFGTEPDTDSGEYEWLTHAIAPSPSPDKDPRIDIGGPQCADRRFVQDIRD